MVGLKGNRIVTDILEILTGVIGNHLRRGKVWFIRNFYPEANGKTKSGGIGKINRSRRNQADFLDREGFAEIDLDPFGRVLVFLDVAVVSVAGTFIVRKGLAKLLS